jgi:hypothetical protein
VRSGAARAVLALALLLALPLAACGKRGPPVAPELRLPAAVQDLQGAVTGEGVQLTWTLPKIRTDRSPVRELRRTEVYRRLEDGAPTEPTRPALLTFGGLFGPPPGVPGFERVANIMLEEPEDGAQVRGGQVTYTDPQGGLTFGRRYTYVVLAVDDQGRPSPPSNRVLLAVAAPPEPPPALVARPGDREVRLSWDPPRALVDGSPAPEGLVYEVLRAPAADAPGRLVTTEPLTARQYVDLGLQNDVTYHYTVRARLGPGGPQSGPSPVAAATPEDTTAPGQPRGLVAVVAGQTIRLAWQPQPDPDVAGYHVYRTTTAGRGYVRLTTAAQAGTTYVDTTVQPGATYYYVVTAVDQARRANESVPSAEVSATIR